MSFIELCEQRWSMMSAEERRALVDRLAIVPESAPWWESEQKKIVISNTSKYDDLPSDLRGRLIMALTSDGFSVRQHQSCVTSMSEIIISSLKNQ